MKKTTHCYIFGAGDYSDITLPRLTSKDYIIAADGGYNYLSQNHLSPNLLIGDFDSLLIEPPATIEKIVLPKEKDETDMLAAVQAGWAKGLRIFHIYGGTGGRLDHTIANIQCLANIAHREGRAYLYDKDTVMTAIHNTYITFPKSAAGMISVFSHSDLSKGVNEHGLKYTLTNATLKNIYPVGVSNEFIGEKSTISVADGTLILLYSNETRETPK